MAYSEYAVGWAPSAPISSGAYLAPCRLGLTGYFSLFRRLDAEVLLAFICSELGRAVRGPLLGLFVKH
jgi:hypothetical protein